MLTSGTQNAFERFCKEAKKCGFAPKIESGYRSFDRQLLIWNEKALGKRKVLDKSGKPIDTAALSETELVKAILLWSALPGASRHEWGTDIDVIDAAAVSENYEAELTIEESLGLFGEFHKWLDLNLFEFRRVFLPGVGRVQPEPWHLSYAPEARKIEQSWAAENLAERLKNSEILLLPQILENLEWILENHFFCYFEK